MLVDPLSRAAVSCSKVWDERETINEILKETLKGLPYGRYLYVLGTDAIQISDNITHEGIETKDFGRDRSQRPYATTSPPERTPESLLCPRST